MLNLFAKANSIYNLNRLRQCIRWIYGYSSSEGPDFTKQDDLTLKAEVDVVLHIAH